MKRFVTLFIITALCTGLIAFTGCGGNRAEKTEKIYLGKEVTLSLKGGADTLKGKVIDYKMNDFITMENNVFIFTVNLQNRVYRLVMDKDENKK